MNEVVIELMEQHKKSKSTIYSWLKSGKIEGYEFIGNKWQKKEDHLIYLNELNLNFQKMKEQEDLLNSLLISQIKLNKQLNQIVDNVAPTSKKSVKKLDPFKAISNKMNKIKKELEETKKYYKEFEEIKKELSTISAIKYSSTSLSVYFTISFNDFIHLMNLMPKLNLSYKLVGKDMQKDKIKVRFSNHFPIPLQRSNKQKKLKDLDILLSLKEDSYLDYEYEYSVNISSIKKEVTNEENLRLKEYRNKKFNSLTENELLDMKNLIENYSLEEIDDYYKFALIKIENKVAS